MEIRDSRKLYVQVLPSMRQEVLQVSRISALAALLAPAPMRIALMKPTPRRAVTTGRILIVDDHERQPTALVAMLSDNHYETQIAADGQEALERLAAFNADVIVSDLVMPRMDGFDLLKQLQEHGDLTPAIMLTGFGSMEKALTAVHDLKAFWYLEKPVEPRAFKIFLERAIRYKRSLRRPGSSRTQASARADCHPTQRGGGSDVGLLVRPSSGPR